MGSGIGTLIPSELGGIGTILPARGSSLLNGLTHYWPLDEVSGQRNDVIGTAHLTDNNTVTSAAGKNGNAASFVLANAEYLMAPANSVDPAQYPVAWTVAGWFSPSATDAEGLLFGNQLGFYLNYRADAAEYRMSMYDGGAYGTIAKATGFTLDGSWKFIVGWIDRADNKARIQLNNGTIFVAATAGAWPGYTFRDFIGNKSASGIGFTGAADEIGIWNRVLTPAERTALYNAGAGKFYPSF